MPGDGSSREDGLASERDFYRRLLDLGGKEEIEPLLDEALALIVEVTGASTAYLELYDDEANRPRFDADEVARDALLERFLAAAEDGDLAALEELLAKDAVLYADSGGKAMAPPEPLHGAALIARFMAAVGQRPAPGFESRRVRVNGQPGRLLRGPGKERYGEAERLAVAKGLALLKSGDVDPRRIATGSRTAGAVPRPQGEVRVWSVLTVDVVEGRIQTCASCATRTSSAISEPRPGSIGGEDALSGRRPRD